MRRALLSPAAAIVLAAPTALAFFSGGYFDTARLAAAASAWALVLVAALAAPAPLPRTRAGRVAIAGIALWTVWTAISFAWTPLSQPASEALQRLLLYTAGLVAAAALLRGRALRRLAEPALAAGALVVVGYGLAGRLLPGVIHEAHSASAGGRLEQPLTYWNAMGALAALGAILSVRVAGDPTRDPRLRAGAAAAVAPLGAGVYLSFSRGALASLALGLCVLAVLVPARPQLRALATTLVPGIVAAAVAGALGSVRTLAGTAATREREGALMLAVLCCLAAAAAAAEWRAAGAEGRGRLSLAAVRRPRFGGAIAAAAIVALFAGLVAYAASDKGGRQPATGANPARLGSLQSNRYAYWRVALRRGFAAHPLNGLGAGGFEYAWLRYRDRPERARVAHSLYVETLAELGIVGFALLLVFAGALAACARRAFARDPALAAGPLAALVVFASHAAVDWDWEMPALALVAIALAGTLVAGAGEAPADAAASVEAPALEPVATPA